MTNYATGHLAEEYAAKYLEDLGFTILALNWKTRYCEIDIIARKAKTIYFVEVKYRKQASQGSGLDYVTSKKQRQMRFAAEVWVNNHDWTDEYVLSAIELSGNDF